MIYTTNSLPADYLSIDIDWRDLSEENREYLSNKFEICEDNEPIAFCLFDGKVWIEYKKEF